MFLAALGEAAIGGFPPAVVADLDPGLLSWSPSEEGGLGDLLIVDLNALAAMDAKALEEDDAWALLPS